MVGQCTLTRIHFTVTVGINVFQVASLPLVAGLKETKIYLSEVCIHFTIGQKEIIRFISPNLTNVHSFIISFISCQTGMIVVYQPLRIIIFGDNSFVIEYIESYAIAKTTFQLVLPVYRQFPTTIT